MQVAAKQEEHAHANILAQQQEQLLQAASSSSSVLGGLPAVLSPADFVRLGAAQGGDDDEAPAGEQKIGKEAEEDVLTGRPAGAPAGASAGVPAALRIVTAAVAPPRQVTSRGRAADAQFGMEGHISSY